MARPYKIGDFDAFDLDEITRLYLWENTTDVTVKLIIVLKTEEDCIELEYDSIAEAKMKFNELYKLWSEDTTDCTELQMTLDRIQERLRALETHKNLDMLYGPTKEQGFNLQGDYITKVSEELTND